VIRRVQHWEMAFLPWVAVNVKWGFVHMENPVIEKRSLYESVDHVCSSLPQPKAHRQSSINPGFASAI